MSTAAETPGLGRREQERAELEAVLASGIFARAPNLAQILSYVCAKYFQGQADHIKEYNIAVEALGRAPDFNQKDDAIVRVEAHRLRKRLKQYYEQEGSHHAVEIVVPPGQYVPMFVDRRSLAAPLDASAAPAADGIDPHAILKTEPIARPLRSRVSRPMAAVLAVAAILVILAAVVTRRLVLPGQASSRSSDATGRALLPAGEELRIAVGSSAPYIDSLGNTWSPDHDFTGGAGHSDAGRAIAKTQDPGLFQSHREGDFRYDILLKPGVYELHLLFAETVYGVGNLEGGGETSRLQNIAVNQRPLLTEFDIVSDAGGSNTADTKIFKDISPAPDGFLHLVFSGSRSRACLSGLEILPGIPGRMRPVRIVARELSYFDKQGRLWGADRYFSGGRTVARATVVAGTDDPGFYKSERYGNFTYTIPVAAGGRYAVTLRFAETWFGLGQPGGAGSRLFDVLCNGEALLKNFDLFKEAGGAARALDKTFHGLAPNAQGKLVLSLVPIKNYACVNAIEVVDEAK